jgi:hypothetical protein
MHGKDEAAAHHLAIEPHGTGAADAVLAADMRSGQAEIVAQEIDQRFARRNARLHVLAVHAHVNVEVERIHAGPGSRSVPPIVNIGHAPRPPQRRPGRFCNCAVGRLRIC